MPIHVRHRNASGRLDEMWEFDPVRCVVDVVFRLANEDPAFASIQVCSPRAPKRLAFPVVRIDGERWRILAARFAENVVEVRGDKTTRLFIPEPFPVHPRLTVGDHIMLCATPPNIDAELEAL